MEASRPPGRWLAYGDAMRVLGVFAVIVVHVCDMILFSDQIGRPHWWVANLIDATGRWAVPVFIMLSGALLLDSSRDESAMAFYRRRLSRLGIAVVFWSAFFMWFAVYYTGWATTGWSAPGSIWRDLLGGKPYVHLHFVVRLAGLYLITPLLRVYVRHADWKLRAQMVAGLLGLGMANSIATCFLGTDPSAFVLLWPFLGFYLAGNVLREIQVTPKIAAWSCVVFVVCALGMSVGTGFLIEPSSPAHPRPIPYPSVDMMLYDFLSPFRVAMSVAAWFMLAFAFGRANPAGRVQRLFKWLGPLTLGIYLVHPIFREILYKNDWLFHRPNVWIGIPATVLIVSVASTVTTYVLSRIPWVRRIVG